MTEASDPTDLRPFEEELASRAADVRGRLSSNDEKILEHLYARLEELPFHTSDSLGRNVGVSRAAVVRFARRLGYSGFTGLQRASRDAVRRSQESPLSRFNAESGSLLERKALNDSCNVHATETLIRDSIGPAARSVAGASRVFVLAALRSSGLAMHAHRLLAGVRGEVHLVNPGFPDEFADFGAGDVVVACLFPRYSRLTVELLELAPKANAQIVLITDGRGPDFASHVDQLIVTAAHSPTLYGSMVGPLFAVEALVAEVAAIEPERSRVRLAAVEDFTERYDLLLR